MICSIIYIPEAQLYLNEYDIISTVKERTPSIYYKFNSTDGFNATKLNTQVPISVPIEYFNIPNNKINIPFEIHALITLNVDKTSCLFSIESDNETKLSLCFERVQEELVNIVLSFSSDVNITIVYKDFDANNPWANILLRVDETVVTLYKNCNFSGDEELEPIKEIKLPKNSKIYLGRKNERDIILFEVRTELAIQLDLNVLKLIQVKKKKRVVKYSSLET
ncbi:unnamed protein product [Euphydryas editha]|uniref:Uncharacterized protein n=1 Tax=Euphydryas editha TaxID=104508 RepID=A0AAU9TWA6_EUPED|nr:unnamed protein product [Euphydryas editha]